ncbi:B-cell receptor CD22-like [Cebidichthys violaceus]|uniref:B-cell receptor CD22-like n=1 Tax=Cebidichthys violaceus TaxID=271503 RepID=UPI0035C96BC8
MSSTAAASGLVVFLLSVQVIQSQDGWGVTYSPTEVCAVKGSTVYISCSYTYPSRIQHRDISNRFWFTKEKDGEPVDLRTNSEYSGRVFYSCYEKWCSLMITDLRENDSAEYKFKIMTNQPKDKYTGSPGVTLSVTGLQVEVSRSDSTWSLMKCLISCVLPDRPSYFWYKNGQKINTGSSLFVIFDSSDNYSCSVSGYEDQRSPSVYAPKLPSVSVSSSAEIVEGSSVTLTCSSDANPAANYTWYKEDGSLEPPLLSEEPHLVFSSIQSSDSGQYYCRAENLMGTKRSESISIDVKYAPKLPSVSVSSSAEIVEGSSVTLTCSSDANPAANYTWYKKNQTRPHGEGGIYRFTSISSEDRGIYYCKSENKHGWIDSSSLVVDVQYAPKLPSVSVSSSAEIVEGSSVTLTCSSDANPAANYTWYKKDVNPDPPLSEEPHLVFSSIQSSDSGQYYCRAENLMGRKRSESIFIDVKYAPKLPSVSVSSSAEIVEGSSVTLTCSSDANPAANYIWYKKDVNPDPSFSEEPHLVFSSIQSSDSGQYYCRAENLMGRKRSESISIDVKYAPKLPSVSVSSSAEIVEGSSVTLTCSSDANPAANYTWYKKDEDSPKASGQIFIITDFRAEHSGSYYCEAQNNRGRSNSTSYLIAVSDKTTMIIRYTRWTLVVVIPILLLLVCLWMRKKKALSSTTEPHEPIETVELHSYPEYENNSNSAAQREDSEEQEDQV